MFFPHVLCCVPVCVVCLGCVLFGRSCFVCGLFVFRFKLVLICRMIVCIVLVLFV